MSRPRWAPAIAALILSTACGRDTRAPAAADTAAAASAPRSVAGFETPESAKYDPDLDVWYVANINGSPVDRDGNGYISRLHGDGSVDSMKWIAGGANGVTLNAPKGMALQADTLWVVDIDVVRGFNRRTGAPVASVTLEGAQFLNDVAVGADGIYATDTGVHADAKGMSHTGPDRVYRIAPDRSQSVALESDSLAGPNGITWDAARKQFVIVPFFGNVIRAWSPGSNATIPLGTSKGQLDGVEILDAERLLVTSWADSSLDVFENGKLTPVAGDLPSPADIGLDLKRGRVAIPLLMENRVEFRMLPTLALGAGAGGAWVAQKVAPARHDAVTTHGEWVKIARGTATIRAYVAYPERKTKAPAVIVIHEIFGLTDWEPTVVDRLAKEGFVAIVPDLLSSKYGVSPANPDSGRKLIAELEPERITADLDATYAYVNALPAVLKDRIGTIGFCWGGGQSFRYATNNPNLRAAVVCYGPAPDSAAFRRIRAPVLGIYGEDDARINAALPGVVGLMQSAGKTFTHEVFPGTGHGFLKPGRQGSDGPQVERAWTRILEFYRARLGK